MTSKEYIDSVLDDNEKVAVEQFANSEVMFEAVRKVITEGLYRNGVNRKGGKAEPLRNAALSLASEAGISNEHLGADLRALWQGLNALEKAFAELEKLKTKHQPERSQDNPAR